MLRLAFAGAFGGSFYRVMREAPGPHNVDAESKLPKQVPLEFNAYWRLHSWWVSRLAGLFVQGVYGMNDVSFEGTERLEEAAKADAVLWAANHNSYLDGWFVSVALFGLLKYGAFVRV